MFGFSREVCVAGVDFGTAAIKLVELTYKKKTVQISNYGEALLYAGTSKEKMENGMTYEARRKKSFEALIKKMRLKSTEMYVSLPGYSGLVALVKFPEMREEELAKAVQYEAHKYVPADMNDVVLSWDVLSRPERKMPKIDTDNKKEGKQNTTREDVIGDRKEEIQGTQSAKQSMEVLLVAALQRDIQKLEKIFDKLPVSIRAIELETFSMAKSLVRPDDGSAHLIIDIGYKVCNIVLVYEGGVRLNRNVDVGGNDFTKTIADSMNISSARAEQLKKGGKNFFQEQSIPLMFPGLELIINEAKRIIQAFIEEGKTTKIDSVILSGGTAGLAGLDGYISETLNIPCTIGDPWKGIRYDPLLKAPLKKRSGEYAVSVGLALRGIEEHKKK